MEDFLTPAIVASSLIPDKVEASFTPIPYNTEASLIPDKAETSLTPNKVESKAYIYK